MLQEIKLLYVYKINAVCGVMDHFVDASSSELVCPPVRCMYIIYIFIPAVAKRSKLAVELLCTCTHTFIYLFLYIYMCGVSM
jgi:hypothetical protein